MHFKKTDRAAGFGVENEWGGAKQQWTKGTREAREGGGVVPRAALESWPGHPLRPRVGLHLPTRVPLTLFSSRRDFSNSHKGSAGPGLVSRDRSRI